MEDDFKFEPVKQAFPRNAKYSGRKSKYAGRKMSPKLDSKQIDRKIKRMGVIDSQEYDDWRQRIDDIPQPALRQKVRNLKSSAEGRGSLTRGWSAVKPRTPRERNELYDECGADCFLEPDSPNYPYHKYPICDRLGEGNDCKIDRRGVQAAYIRSRQWKNQPVANEAKLILDRISGRYKRYPL